MLCISSNKRIFQSSVATYGWSLFALVCGLFSARWVLAAFGQKNLVLSECVDGVVFVC